MDAPMPPGCGGPRSAAHPRSGHRDTSTARADPSRAAVAGYYLPPAVIGTPDLVGGAPTAIYDVQEPGAWQEATTALGPTLGARQAGAKILADHRGGSENYLLDAGFALVSVLADLGFTIATSPAAEDASPGVQASSTEPYPSIDADLLLALGVRPRQQTTGAAVLDSLDT